MMRQLGRSVLAAMVLAIMCGCGAAPTQPVIEATLPQTPTASASPTPDATATATLEPTITQTPSETPTNPPISELTVREPSIEQLDAFLRYYYPTGGELDPFEFGAGDMTRMLAEVDWIYTDVSGDGEDDLIVQTLFYVAVMVWMGDRYSVPYQGGDYSMGRYSVSSQSYLEDWTGDGVPEIVYNGLNGGGYGTGYGGNSWSRRIIHCRADGCNEVLSTFMGGVTYDSNIGGMQRWDAQVELVASDNGTVLIKHFVQSFSLFCCSWGEDSDYPDGLRIDPSYVETYRWTGSTFESLDKEILQAGKQIIPPPIAPAINEFGAVASIEAKFNGMAGMENNFCQLAVDGENVGEFFGCRNFVTIRWQDITGDNQIELVVIALSPVVTDYDPAKWAKCYHQRLIAYEWSQLSGIGEQIANVIGCVVRSDLYGVRLEDLDGDGALEIIAAARDITEHEPYEWFEFDNHDDIYRWNGSEYVYSETVTRE